MKTKSIEVTSGGKGLEETLDTAETFAKDLGLDERSSRRLRLLTEETLAMVRSITQNFVAAFWLEAEELTDGKNLCRLHLSAQTFMDYMKKQDLISTATRKENAAAVGIMGKIRDIIENSCYGLVYSDFTGGFMPGSGADYYMWSLEKYREDSGEDDELLDELEKSIVANIADEIKVAIKGNQVEMTIEKTFA